MKKLLITSALLVATAGIASADCVRGAPQLAGGGFGETQVACDGNVVLTKSEADAAGVNIFSWNQVAAYLDIPANSQSFEGGARHQRISKGPDGIADTSDDVYAQGGDNSF